jgi:hypothetical protein
VDSLRSLTYIAVMKLLALVLAFLPALTAFTKAQEDCAFFEKQMSVA